VGEVEGKVEEGVGAVAGAEPKAFFGDFLAGVRGGGDEDEFFGVFGTEFGDEGFDGEDFADGDGVDPDEALAVIGG